jgi:hypothetical protein
MQSQGSKKVPFLLEVEIPKGISREKIYFAADNVEGSPILICKHTKKISAYVQEALARDGLFILDVLIVDPVLEENFNDYEYVVANYHEVDPIAPLLGLPF